MDGAGRRRPALPDGGESTRRRLLVTRPNRSEVEAIGVQELGAGGVIPGEYDDERGVGVGTELEPDPPKGVGGQLLPPGRRAVNGADGGEVPRALEWTRGESW